MHLSAFATQCARYVHCLSHNTHNARCLSHKTRCVGHTIRAEWGQRGRASCKTEDACISFVASHHHVITSSWHFVPHKESPRNIEKEQNMPPRTRGWPPSSNSTGTHAQRLAHKCASMHACTRARVHARTHARILVRMHACMHACTAYRCSESSQRGLRALRRRVTPPGPTRV